jgi:hypothetical protein
MKIQTKNAIRYLVEAYRAALEDDGDLVAKELEQSSNGQLKATYQHEDDTLLVIFEPSLVELYPRYLFEGPK